MDVKTVRDEMRVLRYNTYHHSQNKEMQEFFRDFDKLLEKWISLLEE